jgi:hypothetical protein
MDGVAQVNTVVVVLLVIPGITAEPSVVIVTELVEVHPLVPVTVTVYVAGVLTDSAAAVPTTVLPLLQE